MVACVAGALPQLVMPLYFHYSYVFAYDRADASIPFKTPARTSKSGGSAGGSSGGSGCRSTGGKHASRRLLSPALSPCNLVLVDKIASDVECHKAKAHAAVAIKAAEMAQAEALEATDAAEASDLAREEAEEGERNATANAAVAEATTCKAAAAAKEAAAETKRAYEKQIEVYAAELQSLQKTKTDLELQETKNNAELQVTQETKKKYEYATVGLVFAMLAMMLAYMLS